MALRDVMDHVVETSKSSPKRPVSRVRNVVAIGICVLLLGASTYSWIARPEAIWGPSGEPASPVIDRASARMSMAIIAQRLHEARTQTGAYPLTLQDIGEAATGIDYSLVGDTLFVLSARSGADSIVYRSNEPLEELLGRSADLLARARR